MYKLRDTLLIAQRKLSNRIEKTELVPGSPEQLMVKRLMDHVDRVLTAMLMIERARATQEMNEGFKKIVFAANCNGMTTPESISEDQLDDNSSYLVGIAEEVCRRAGQLDNPFTFNPYDI